MVDIPLLYRFKTFSSFSSFTSSILREYELLVPWKYMLHCYTDAHLNQMSEREREKFALICCKQQQNKSLNIELKCFHSNNAAFFVRQIQWIKDTFGFRRFPLNNIWFIHILSISLLPIFFFASFFWVFSGMCLKSNSIWISNIIRYIQIVYNKEWLFVKHHNRHDSPKKPENITMSYVNPLESNLGKSSI